MAEAHAKIDARKALQAVLDAQDGDLDTLRQAIAKLERIEAELGRGGEAIRQTESAPR